jgi:hypothetical protein
MDTLLSTAAKIAKRAMPATAVAAVAALSVGAYAGYAARLASRGHQPTFTLTATPAHDTIAAGSTGGYRLFLHRRRFPWGITFKLERPLPPGVGARFAPLRTLQSRSTLTLRTHAWTPPGVYRLILDAGHGRVTKKIALTLSVAGDSPGSGKVPAALPQIAIAGNADVPLEPGVPEGIDIQITNPNSAPVVVTGLTARLQSVSAPNATGALPCTLGDFALQQYSGPLPLTIPASSTRSLAQFGDASAQWPQVAIIDRPTNQDGCQGATVTVAYSALGTVG